MHGPHGLFAPAFGTSSEPTVHSHHGVVCQERNNNGECVHYYAPGLHYRGGEVVKEPKLYLIFYGSNWNTIEEDKKWKGALLNTLRGMTSEYAFDETYQRILHQYWDEQTEPKQISNSMSVAGEWTYEGASAPQDLTEENVELAVNQAIETNHWHREKDAIFMLMEPTGSAWTNEFAKFTECGYHYVDRWSDVYALIPNDNDSHFNAGCVIGTNQRAETETATHEYTEAVTDPHPQEGGTPGWTNSEGYEVADLCDEEPELLNETLSIWVSSVWGNAEKTCVIHDPPENPPSPPTVATEPATAIAYHGATLNGEVNPNEGPEPRYYFEYGTTTSYGSYAPAPPGPGLGSSGGSNVPVDASLSGLKVGTKYHYRLTSATWAGNGAGADGEFTTPIPPPAASTEAATQVGETQATLNGSVDPEEVSTTYQFEYWPSGKSTEIKVIPTTAQSVGSGTSYVHVTQAPEGLASLTEYTYRVVASSAGGITYGKEARFRTGPFAVNHPSATPSGAEWIILSGMSCNTNSACMAVGSAGIAKVVTPLAEAWNGSEWRLVSPSMPTGAKEASLEGGVSCTSATACTSVGKLTSTEGHPAVLVERWNGSSWSTQSTPTEPLNDSYALYGVSCSSSTVCMAVGTNITGPLEGVPLAESWNGSEWKVLTMPTSKGQLNALSCSSGAACTAVGSTGFAGEPMAERWNGSEWSLQTVAKITGASLSSVSCASSTSCIAVGWSGGYAYGPPAANISETWNGSTWSTAAVPAPPGAQESQLRGVSCISTTSCLAVGLEGEVIGKHSALADWWNGSEWRIMSVVLSPGSKGSNLKAISCTSTLCSAGGTYEPSTGGEGTLVAVSGQPFAATEAATNVSYESATLNGNVEPNGRKTTFQFEYGETTAYGKTVPSGGGTVKPLYGAEHLTAAVTGLSPQTTYHYRIVSLNASGVSYGADKTFTTPSPPWSTDSVSSPNGAEWVITGGISCTSTSSCIAVGGYGASKLDLPFAESWNGVEWKLLAPPLPSEAKEGGFDGGGVSCTSSTACTAVGKYTTTGGAFIPLVERWNGSTWSIQSTPAAPAKDYYELHGVACTSATSCIIAGANITGVLESVPLTERWNGSEWTVLSTPGSKGQLNAISCFSGSACMAVGSTGFAGNPMAVQWNGTEWATTSTQKYSSGASFSGVACGSTVACVAVGWSGGYAFGPVATNISETWNGSSWVIASVPAPTGAKESLLRGISCGTATWCFAVGIEGEVIGKHAALTDVWNGKEWQITSLPLPTGTTEWRGVSCAAVYCSTGGSAETKVLIDSN